jgi:hypothetical protein
VNPQQQPEVPTYQPASTQTSSTPTGRNNRKILALWLLIGPTALIISSILLYAVVNFILGATAPTPTSGELIGPSSPVQTILNVILFLAGMLSVITWLPGIIAGIILLATSKKN